MKINNIDQWKNEIRKIAKEKNISIDDMQQRYILEEFIRKISKSDYKDNLIIKGGFMISTLIGIENRTTRDIDVTYNSTIYNKRELEIIFNNIISTNTNSFFEYEVVDITKQQLNDKYKGYCCKMIAKKAKQKYILNLIYLTIHLYIQKKFIIKCIVIYLMMISM